MNDLTLARALHVRAVADGAFLRLLRVPILLLTLALVPIVGTVAASHGWMF